MSSLLQINYRTGITISQTLREEGVKVEKREGRDTPKYQSPSYPTLQEKGLTVMCYIIFCLQMSDFFFHYM